MPNPAPRPRDVARHMVAVCEMLWKDGDRVLRTAKDNESPLRARHHDTGRGGKGTVEDETGNVGCSRSERRTLFDSFGQALRELDDSLIRVRGIHDRIMGKGVAPDKPTRPGEGHCVACGEWMPGTPQHRIKDGFCPSHTSGWSKAKREGFERAKYVAKVRQQRGYDGRHS